MAHFFLRERCCRAMSIAGGQIMVRIELSGFAYRVYEMPVLFTKSKMSLQEKFCRLNSLNGSETRWSLPKELYSLL